MDISVTSLRVPVAMRSAFPHTPPPPRPPAQQHQAASPPPARSPPSTQETLRQPCQRRLHVPRPVTPRPSSSSMDPLGIQQTPPAARSVLVPRHPSRG
eukprot:213959-Amphidinium_carterae.1